MLGATTSQRQTCFSVCGFGILQKDPPLLTYIACCIDFTPCAVHDTKYYSCITKNVYRRYHTLRQRLQKIFHDSCCHHSYLHLCTRYIPFFGAQQEQQPCACLHFDIIETGQIHLLQSEDINSYSYLFYIHCNEHGSLICANSYTHTYTLNW